MRGPLLGRCLAEAAGTWVLVVIGTGSIVAGSARGGVPQWVLALAWFAAVALPILLVGRLSGAHLNPAVTLASALARQLPRHELGAYVVAQIAGAFVGTATVALALGTGGHLGATLPSGGDLALIPPLEGIATTALLVSALWLGSPGRVARAGESLAPAVVVGISTFLIGPWTGSSLNPARSIAPAVVSGDFLGLWVYLAVQLVAAASVGWVWGRACPVARAPPEGGPSGHESPPELGPRRAAGPPSQRG